MRLTGDRNQCQGCKEFFNSTFAFDKHRSGDHAGGQRYCLAPEAMLAKGMDKNAAGFWISSAMPEAAIGESAKDRALGIMNDHSISYFAKCFLKE